MAVDTPAEGPEPSPPVAQLRLLSKDTAQNPAADEPADYALPDGHFYRQGAASASPIAGYAVTGAMWRALEMAGGVPALGFPISRPWRDAEGRTSQVFQRGILQVAVVGGRQMRGELANVLDLLSAAGKDEWLERTYQTPPGEVGPEEAWAPRQQVEREQLSLLDRDPAIREAFLVTPDWRDRFGLPLAIRRFDGVVTLRAQRAILRHWLVDAPEAAAGTVTVTDGGVLAKAAGLLPGNVARPISSPLYGWLRVSGRHIVDGRGNPVRLAGVNWSGFELRDFVPLGLAIRDYIEVIDQVAALGFNTVRLPFSNEMIERNPLPNERLVVGCPACQGKRALEIMDLIVDYAGRKGLRVILDNHFSAASDQAGAVLWYTRDYPEQAWLNDWLILADRYRDNPAVIGFDLRNEPHGPASWGSGDPATDWRLAVEKAGRAILDVNPNLLIIVEGIEQFPKPGGGNDLTWWGGNLQGARQFPVRLPQSNLLYSPHEYGPSLYRQPWFNAGTTAESLFTVWERYWAFLNLDHDFPLLVGELGTGNAASDVEDQRPGSQGQWFQTILALLRARDNLHWLYWTINAEDDFALLDASYAAVANPTKLAVLKTVMGQAFPALPSLRSAGDIAEVSGQWKVQAQ